MAYGLKASSCDALMEYAGSVMTSFYHASTHVVTDSKQTN